MTDNIEYVIYNESDRLATLESRAAELRRRLREATPPGGLRMPDLDEPDQDFDLPWPGPADGDVRPRAAGRRSAGRDRAGYDQAGDGSTTEFFRPPGAAAPHDATDGFPPPRDASRDGRTEALINRGRRSAGGGRLGWLRGHWRALAWVAGMLCFLVLVVTLVLPGAGAGWPASVAQVQAEITVACQNPNVAAEPSQVNFACAKDTQRVLWVFSLLTSGDNPAFSDGATGRRGLEPIQPAQGGAIAWSLNMHHPYNPASPVDSLQVAARAINNIIGGATLTSSAGTPLVQPGLESSAANCQRYTGSSRLITRAGFPARCARQVTSEAGLAHLVSDVFAQWMSGTTAQVAQQAGVLFSNADNPGDSRVQAILAALPAGL
jgi:hypothetical protein